MLNLTDVIIDRLQGLDSFDSWLECGAELSRRRDKAALAWKSDFRRLYASIRKAHGFAEVDAPILTAPESNMKLDKGKVPAYGITLQHYVQKMSTGITINACPWAGHCTKVCVLDNGMGRYDTVQRARRAKTEFLARHPHAFAFLLGEELAKVAERMGRRAYYVRPNVNSDVAWEKIAPRWCEGFGVKPPFGNYALYGYSKNAALLDGDGWLGARYRVAYSWNEASCLVDRDVQAFLDRGGSVAVVTNRKPKADIDNWGPNECNLVGTLLDADLSDEWLFDGGVIGDLSAKGKARKLIGKSAFVVEAY